MLSVKEAAELQQLRRILVFVRFHGITLTDEQTNRLVELSEKQKQSDFDRFGDLIPKLEEIMDQEYRKHLPLKPEYGFEFEAREILRSLADMYKSNTVAVLGSKNTREMIRRVVSHVMKKRSTKPVPVLGMTRKILNLGNQWLGQ